MIITGQFGASSIKYKFVDFTSNNTIKTADISTSRVSSWSSFDSPATLSSPIVYGGQVVVEGPLELSNLVLNSPKIPRRFESEIPTNKIKVKIDGQDTFLYLMKGIPLTFVGFFRSLRGDIRISQIGSIRPSWVIRNTDNNLEYVYQNRLSSGTVSAINFSDSSAREREVEFYYPPDNITSISLPNIKITEFPSVTMTNLATVNLSNNDIREIPDFSNFTSLSSLNISNNNLTRSANTLLRTFSAEVVARIPSSTRTLTIGNCFEGVVTGNLASIPLTTLNLNNGEGRLGRRLTGTSPDVNSSTIENYNVNFNLFTTVSSSVTSSTSLKSVVLSHNSFNQTNISFASDNLEYFEMIGGTGSRNIVDVSNKQLLTQYISRGAPISPAFSTITSIFDGCTSLQNIQLHNTNASGAFPTLLACRSLRSFNIWNTRVTNANSNFVLDQNSLDGCRASIQSIAWASSTITNVPIHPNAFDEAFNLSYIAITSRNAGISGNLPSFSTNRELRYVILYNNQLSGFIPSFAANNKLLYLHLYGNNFTGNIPNIVHPSLQFMFLSYNQLSGFNPLLCVNLRFLHAAFNQITQIPDISNLVNLEELFCNNNLIAKYTLGSFVPMTNIRNINLSNNLLTQGDINQIIIDLEQNYNNRNRSGVFVNLRGNSVPSISDEIQDRLTKLRQAGWSIQTD